MTGEEMVGSTEYAMPADNGRWPPPPICTVYVRRKKRRDGSCPSSHQADAASTTLTSSLPLRRLLAKKDELIYLRWPRWMVSISVVGD